MNLTEFTASIALAEPPVGLSLALQGLWWEAKGDWNRAHERAQKDGTPSGASVHAYLHRVEGDLSNAGYWYDRAKQPLATGPLQEEWEALVRDLLERIHYSKG
jgi:hypothetical protein